MKPVFDENGLAKEPGNIRCFYYDELTGEYTGWSDEYIHVGVSMPGRSTDIDPGDEIPGKVAVFTGGAWIQQEDHRGTVVYSTADGSTVTVDYIGSIRDGCTNIAPSTPYDKWDGHKWVMDVDAANAADLAVAEREKTQLRTVADAEIAWRQDAVDAGIATEGETAALAEWKKYRVLLMRVDTTDPDWPTVPEA
ncbi:tail fiber assembly protein [Salmonella enterica]|nr:tail fiber assembly protein [Salmonella enterica]EFN9195148.1 tail fiber assembly protein [Escherichia coli]EBB9999207.1 tail fiber assembly protein [Salmonella enterica]EBE5685114.1 tail fiber assembly protein [Salmonella enterica]EBU4847019.1 tail fiber assembly protein [Salmonella enterica]